MDEAQPPLASIWALAATWANVNVPRSVANVRDSSFITHQF